MRLTEERVQVLGTQIMSALRRRSDLMSFRGDPARLSREVTRWILEDLRIEDEITQEAVNRVAGYGRGIPPGTSEWQVLVDKHKDEIVARRGYVLG